MLSFVFTATPMEDDSLLADMSVPADGRKPSGGQSWGNSRLPPSLQPSVSPSKSPNKTPSPAKSSNNTTPDASPVKVGHIYCLLEIY